MIIIHHIGSKNGSLYGVGGTVTWFTNEEVHRNKTTGKIENKVSAHYIVPREEYKSNDIIHLVSHNDIAYHAGFSQWSVNGKTRSNLNNYSIGIELEGDGNFVEYTDFQYENLIELVKNITSAHDIPYSNIVGHEDVSPGRKVDPGKLFDWKRFRTGINTTVVSMPEVEIKPDTPLETEPPKTNVCEMGGGENHVGKPANFLSLILNLILKAFK
jgi:N-acetyl-anhydromuramyl-L-alanine amidase AmpD